MLNLLHLGAALATVVSTQFTGSSLPTSTDIVVNNTNTTASIVTTDSGNDILEQTQKIDPAWLLGLAAVGGGVAVAVAFAAL